MTKSFFLWALRVKCCTRLQVNYSKCHGFFLWKKFDHDQSKSLVFMYYLEKEKKLPLAILDNLRRFDTVNDAQYPHWPCLHDSQA